MFFPPEQVQKAVLLNAWKIHIFPKWLISAEKSTMIEAIEGGGGWMERSRRRDKGEWRMAVWDWEWKGPLRYDWWCQNDVKKWPSDVKLFPARVHLCNLSQPGLWPRRFNHLIVKPFWSHTSMNKHCINIFWGNNEIPEIMRKRDLISYFPPPSVSS